MDERVSRSSPLDLSESHEVATLEIAVPMLEFPECGIRGPGVEDIANYGGG